MSFDKLNSINICDFRLASNFRIFVWNCQFFNNFELCSASCSIMKLVAVSMRGLQLVEQKHGVSVAGGGARIKCNQRPTRMTVC